MLTERFSFKLAVWAVMVALPLPADCAGACCCRQHGRSSENAKILVQGTRSSVCCSHRSATAKRSCCSGDSVAGGSSSSEKAREFPCACRKHQKPIVVPVEVTRVKQALETVASIGNPCNSHLISNAQNVKVSQRERGSPATSKIYAVNQSWRN